MPGTTRWCAPSKGTRATRGTHKYWCNIKRSFCLSACLVVCLFPPSPPPNFFCYLRQNSITLHGQGCKWGTIVTDPRARSWSHRDCPEALRELMSVPSLSVTWRLYTNVTPGCLSFYSFRRYQVHISTEGWLAHLGPRLNHQPLQYTYCRCWQSCHSGYSNIEVITEAVVLF